MCLLVSVSDLFWRASIADLKSGYIERGDSYICLLCGETVEKGIVYPEEGVFYEACRYMRHHIEKDHQSVFEHISRLDKKLTGLTEHQTNLIRLFYQGKSDGEIQKEMGIGSASTIRNHRYALKEKERQSKVTLVLMELLKEKDNHDTNIPNYFKKSEMLNERCRDTPSEADKLLKNLFPQGVEGPLRTFSLKEKHKLIVLQEISKRFQVDQTYHEKEVNQILKKVYHDFALLRRSLIEYGFFDRTPDGSQYWLKSNSLKEEELTMDRKQLLKQQYKETTNIEAGIYQIKNTINGKVLLEGTLNLKTMNGKRFTLDTGTFQNKELQSEWQEYGKEAFAFDVLEIMEIPEEGYFDAKDSLKKLKEKWLNKLQPYGERGYNTIRRQ